MTKRVFYFIIASMFCFESCVDQYCIFDWVDFEFRVTDFSNEQESETNNDIDKYKNALTFQMSMIKNRISSSHSDKKGCKDELRNNSVKSITIKTLYDYSDIYKAGSDISSLFMVTFVFGMPIPLDENMTIDELISYLDLDTTKDREWEGSSFNLCLFDDTCTNEKQKFEITIEFSDNIVSIKETDELTTYQPNRQQPTIRV